MNSAEKKLWVYVAGPYTKGDVCENVAKAVRIGMSLRELGFVPIIPHLFHFAHYLSYKPYDFWLSWDFDLLEKCDAIFLLPGESSGAEKEVEQFSGKVFNKLSSLMAWKDER